MHTHSQLKVAFFDTKPYARKAFESHNVHGFDFHFFNARLNSRTARLAEGCNVVCAFVNDTIDQDTINTLQNVGIQLITMRCAGYNNVDLTACRHANISVTRVPAYSPYAVAEHAVALLLALNRKVHRAFQRVREGNFSLNGLVGFDLYKKNIGIIGTGKIGKVAATIFSGFGCNVLAYDPYPDEEWAKSIDATYVGSKELFSTSDVISLHAPLTSKTHHFIDTSALNNMKKGVFIINTSRGGLIDTKALIQALKAKKIGGAGLDVYEEEAGYFFEDWSEEVITDDVLARLLSFNNVLITSHQGFLTHEALENIATSVIESIVEYQAGKPLTHSISE